LKALKSSSQILVLSFVLLLVTFSIPQAFPSAFAQSNLHCSDGQVLVYRIISEKYACLNPPSADKWYKSGIAEPVEQISVEAKPHPEKMISAAPIPDAAIGPAIDFSKGYLVEEISDGLYWVTDGAYNTIFLTTGEGVIVVDAPPSIGENYLNAIAEVTDEPITHVIYSHSHIDHIGAGSQFPSEAVIIAQQETASTLQERNDSNRPIPTVTFEDNYTLEVGNQILELQYQGPMHVSGNIFIYAPQQKVLMLVDVVFQDV